MSPALRHFGRMACTRSRHPVEAFGGVNENRKQFLTRCGIYTVCSLLEDLPLLPNHQFCQVCFVFTRCLPPD